MVKNERTSRKIAKIASKALRGKRLTRAEKKSLGASALTQAPNKRKRRWSRN